MIATHHFIQVLQAWVDISKRRSMQEFSRWMKVCGLSKSQIGTLMHLYYHGSCSVSRVGDDLGITTAAASQLVDRLVQMQLLERSENPADRRIKQVSLSQSGQDLIQRGVEAHLGWIKDLAGILTLEEQVDITQALETLIEAAREQETRESMINPL